MLIRTRTFFLATVITVGLAVCGSEANASDENLQKPLSIGAITYGLEFPTKQQEVRISTPTDIEEEDFSESKSNFGAVLSSEDDRKYGTNCVSFVRSLVPNMPNNLWDLKSKRDMINSSEPKVGAVAVTSESPEGHVAIIREILEDEIIIEETNFHRGKRTTRKIPKALPEGYLTI